MNSSARLQAAPHEVWQRPFVKVHQSWCDGFVLELRLKDVPGRVIGERLAEVERHCAETDETPSEAFGDPTDYATRIHEDSSPERVSGVWTMAAVSSAQVLALLVGTAAVPVWARGEQLTYNLGQIVCLALTLLLLLSLPSLLGPLLRHPWVFGLPLMTAIVLGAGGAALSARSDLPTVVQLPAPAVAVGLFVAVLVLAWIEYRELAGDAEDELVTSPLSATPGQPQTREGRGRRITLLLASLIPVAYLALATFGWLFA